MSCCAALRRFAVWAAHVRMSTRRGHDRAARTRIFRDLAVAADRAGSWPPWAVALGSGCDRSALVVGVVAGFHEPRGPRRLRSADPNQLSPASRRGGRLDGPVLALW